MLWTTEQKIFIFEAYFRQESIHAAKLQFKERFGCREFPVHSVIYRWVKRFTTHGTVHNINRKDTNRQSHSGRPKSSRTPHNVAAVRDSVVQSPKTTTSGLWQSTPNDMSRDLASSAQHLFDGGGSSGSSSGSSRMVPRRHLKRIIGMATAAFPRPTDQPQVWPAVVAAFTRLELHSPDTLRTGCMAATPRLSLT